MLEMVQKFWKMEVLLLDELGWIAYRESEDYLENFKNAEKMDWILLFL